MTEPTPRPSFDGLGLSEAVLAAVRAVGYESPSPIQQAAIPPLLAGPRRARPGADRHRQDGRVRAAAAVPHRPEARRAAVARADADARARDSSRRGHADLRPPPQRLPRAAHLRRHGHGLSVEAAAPRRARRRRHAGPHPGSPAPQDAEARQARGRRHRRSRRDAAHGLHRGRREHLGRDAREEAGGALLRDVARSHSQGRRASPQGSRRGQDQDEDRHGRGRRPAFRRGARLRQARRADAHPRGRGFRRDADLRAHSPGDGRAQREARGARPRECAR